jgi:hypothetical protein
MHAAGGTPCIPVQLSSLLQLTAYLVLVDCGTSGTLTHAWVRIHLTDIGSVYSVTALAHGLDRGTNLWPATTVTTEPSLTPAVYISGSAAVLQANVEPLLLLANKYNLVVPLHMCMDFLKKHYNKSSYTSLPSGQLGSMLHWLATTRQLQLYELHASIMACLADSLNKLNLPGTRRNSTRQYCSVCPRQDGRYLSGLGYCSRCDAYDEANLPYSMHAFHQIWAASAPLTKGAAVKELLFSAQPAPGVQRVLNDIF